MVTTVIAKSTRTEVLSATTLNLLNSLSKCLGSLKVHLGLKCISSIYTVTEFQVLVIPVQWETEYQQEV